MRKLSIPYTKDNKLLDLLTLEELQYAGEIFMPLPYDIMPSGRSYSKAELDEYKTIFDTQIKKAKELDLKVNILGSKPILDLDTGMSTILRTVRELERIKPLGADKVTISNLTFLKLQGEYIKNLGYEIELSVVSNIDSVEKIDQLMYVHPYIDSICLYNNFLNEGDALNYIRTKYNKLKLKILVNHLCMYNCAAHVEHHDIQCNIMVDKMDTSNINEWRLFSNQRQIMPSSKLCNFAMENRNINVLRETSFLRPEDLGLYDNFIDLYKISGREHPADEILKWIKIYGERKYSGNLLDIVDVPFNPTYGLDNEKFPEAYASTKFNCSHKCYKCGYCNKIIEDVKIKASEAIIPPTGV
ncbi:hypothetical protein KYB31_06660 [Clostridium felsineum]|uniref:hypothetical protein n=1 Tax=Clostridium felsineum TaxID=36839 RepID=UPI00214DBCC7|nr:hypothetical protein [Clostridium felsineum]MCR3758676.1 hypothetical protein [Clostridium felsineum]